MLTAVLGAAVLGLIVAFVVAVARDPGPPPDDVALAYEQARDRLDSYALWTLSGDGLRGGLDRHDFIAARRDTHTDQVDRAGPSAAVTVEHLEIGNQFALVHTGVVLRDGSAAHNELELEQRAGRWVVVAYRVGRADPSAASS